MKDEIEDFFEDINSLKHSERQGWLDHGVDPPRDTIASHSFGAAMLAWVIAEEEDADSDEAVKRALIHDMIMAHVPDLTPRDEAYDEKEKLEREKMEELLSNLPVSIREGAGPMVREEIEGIESLEARIAKDADRLDTILQAREYADESSGDIFEEFLESLGDDVSTGSGRDFLSNLKSQNSSSM